MQEIVNIAVVDYFTAGDVDKLQEMLKTVGIEIEKSKTAGGHTHVIIKFDTLEFKKKMGRSAGRHEKGAFDSLTLQQYKARLAAGETVAQIAESVGLSRATLYRRVKATENMPGADDSMKQVTW